MSTEPDPVSLDVRRIGRTRYEDAHTLQQELVAQRVEGRIGDVLLLTEHDPVVTRGRKSPPGDADGVDVPVVTVERGGEATYHGPGQIVGYPIVFLPEGRRDLHRYLRDLEEVVIRAIGDFDVIGRRVDGYTGVWIGDRKVCSLGVAVRRWVTWHGFALNVATDLSAFRAFHPCGLDPNVMTNLAEHVGVGHFDPAEGAPARDAFVSDVEARVVQRFSELFGYDEYVERIAR